MDVEAPTMDKGTLHVGDKVPWRVAGEHRLNGT